MKHLLFVGSICLALLLAASTWAQDPELVIYYSFDNFADSVPDLSGKGHDGVVVGDITPDAGGKRDGAARFTTGSYSDLEGANFPGADIPTSGFTLCAWIRCENTGQDHGIFNARAGDSTWLIHPDVRSGGQYRFCLRGDGDIDICDIRGGTVAWDEWTHYAGTYSRASGKAVLYINGEVLQEIDALADVGIAGDWDLGARVGYNIDNDRPFTGLMDDFCMYKRALSQDELRDVMAGGPPSAAPVPDESTLSTTWGGVKYLR
jgi:hypothetical protein